MIEKLEFDAESIGEGSASGRIFATTEGIHRRGL
jgi:hypothetical protein